ncbi:MAG: RHS repeat-associated core domain-containing protein [Acidobacteriaceae bacterium]
MNDDLREQAPVRSSWPMTAWGRRFGKTMLGANTNFLYDGLNPVQELNGTTATANLLTGGVDERFTRTDATGTFSYLTDAFGSTIALTDSTGNSDVQYSYDPYGSMSITGTTTNSYAYTGREFDGLGIDYYRARYYNPTVDRFISEDSLGFQGGINQYAYVADDPVDFFDPLGMDRQPGPPPWHKNRCITNALLSGAGSTALDAVGTFVPAGGAAEGAVAGAFSLWHGAAGVSQGRNIFRGVMLAGGIVNTASAGSEGNSVSVGLGVLGIAATLGKAAPGVGQIISGISMGVDIYQTAVAVGKCN